MTVVIRVVVPVAEANYLSGLRTQALLYARRDGRYYDLAVLADKGFDGQRPVRRPDRCLRANLTDMAPWMVSSASVG